MIVRVQKHENPYVIIDKTILEDDRLTFKARGLAAYLLGKPDDWSISERHLVKCGPDGAAAIRSGLKELEEAGYLKRNRRRTDDGKFSWEATLYEVPQPCRGFPRVDKPRTDNPHVEKPHVDNRAILKNDLPRNEELRNEEQKTTTGAPAAEEPEAQTVAGGRRRHRDHDSDFGEICRLYEQEFGFLSPIAADQLSDLLDEYKSKQMVIDAFEVSVQANKRSLRYVDGILRNWRSEGKKGPRKEGARAKSRSEKPVEGWHAGLVKEWQPDDEWDLEEIQRWADSLDNQPPVPAVRPLRKRPGAAA